MAEQNPVSSEVPAMHLLNELEVAAEKYAAAMYTFGVATGAKDDPLLVKRARLHVLLASDALAAARERLGQRLL